MLKNKVKSKLPIFDPLQVATMISKMTAQNIYLLFIFNFENVVETLDLITWNFRQIFV